MLKNANIYIYIYIFIYIYQKRDIYFLMSYIRVSSKTSKKPKNITR